MSIGESELILNADGSVYHLNLLPQDIASTIILVGDPNRVNQVSRFFDTIEVKKEKREFKTHTGVYHDKRLTVLSTGIGGGNIDIVLNELDALVNIDLTKRQVKTEKKSLTLIRIGTSGAIQPEISVDSFLLSEFAIGLDSMLHFYEKEKLETKALTESLQRHLNWDASGIVPYVTRCDELLKTTYASNRVQLGITVTSGGFYAPQGRQLRLHPKLNDFHSKLTSFKFNGNPITNLEMETAAIYGLAKLLGHKAISLNAILANRSSGIFSKHPKKTIEALIQHTLTILTQKQ